MIAETRKHLVDAVGGRGKAYLVEEYSSKGVATKEFSETPKRFASRSRIVRTGEPECFVDLGSSLRPASPTAAALTSPIHDKVRIFHFIDIGENVIP